jgi:predicted metal-dependent hydrolase
VTETVALGNLRLVVRRGNRRTVEVSVDRDGSLAVYAPQGTPLHVLARLARRKEEWIHQKLAEKRALQEVWCEPIYEPGLSFSYLGRGYRLRFVDDPGRHGLRLTGGWFELPRAERDAAALAFAAWYGRRGQEWLPGRIELLARRLGIEPGRVMVRDLNYRWASCGRGAIYFHWRTLALPAHIIDYVAVHELAHKVEARHSRRFWELVCQAMPDFEARREWLANRGRSRG